MTGNTQTIARLRVPTASRYGFGLTVARSFLTDRASVVELPQINFEERKAAVLTSLFRKRRIEAQLALGGRVMKRLRIIPGRWHRRLALSLHCRLCSTNDRWRLIQVLFSSTGGGGPPAPSLYAR
jgi:hypothetical protein